VKDTTEKPDKPQEPRTERFGKPDLEGERVIEQQEGIVAEKGGVKDSDRPAPNVPHPEDLSMMDSAKTKGRSGPS
jgi:hypothetical protein